jgi:hypothetical protein
MGMTIEEIMYRLQAMTTMCTFQDAVGHDLSQKEIKLYNQAKDQAIDTMRKYKQLQADYEARLKADMVAMLTEIQLEIEELDTANNNWSYMNCSDIIQQKINALKGVEDGNALFELKKETTNDSED